MHVGAVHGDVRAGGLLMNNIPEEVFERARRYEQEWQVAPLTVVDFLTSIADEYRIESAAAGGAIPEDPK